MSLMTKLADSMDGSSLANRLRAKRFMQFEEFSTEIPRPLKILDVGGTNLFWEQRGWAGKDGVSITLVNLVMQVKKHTNITPVVGNATDRSQFADCWFDVAFSNSTIEHLGSLASQEQMAAEVRRVARSLWIQTPNFWFPMEPHFCVPGWQWLPTFLRVAILRRARCGWIGPYREKQTARRAVGEIPLITRKELRSLFPHAEIIPEWFGGLVKSWTVLEHFETVQEASAR